MIYLVSKQCFRGINDAFAAGDGAPNILAGLIPEYELRLAAFAVLKVVGVFIKCLVRLGRGLENPGFLGVKQAGYNEIPVLLERDDLFS